VSRAFADCLRTALISLCAVLALARTPRGQDGAAGEELPAPDLKALALRPEEGRARLAAAIDAARRGRLELALDLLDAATQERERTARERERVAQLRDLREATLSARLDKTLTVEIDGKAVEGKLVALEPESFRDAGRRRP
jgi:hypothetical protein